MTCTKRTARCLDARSYSAKLADCCRGHVIELVRTVGDMLTAAGVTWWADYGTLLGAVRNPLTTWADYPWLEPGAEPIAPGIIPHDKDADVGVLFTDFRRVMQLRGRLGLLGYWVMHRPGGASVKVRISRYNATNLDLFFWREDGDRLYRPSYIAVDQFKGRDLTRDQLFPLTTVEWEGMMLPAPHDPAAFCAYRYGPNWRTPVMANNDGVRR